MEWNLPPRHPLRELFHGWVQHVFMTEVGICNHRLLDYVGDILIEFIHVDRIYRLRTVDGQVIREISRMEADACIPVGASTSERTRLISRYVGDFTLFWAGVYPEALRPRGCGVDRLREYLLQGKRSYEIAGSLSPPDTHPPGDLLRELSQEFEACVHGLQRVREGWRSAAMNLPG
jgi:hypothetical protein